MTNIYFLTLHLSLGIAIVSMSIATTSSLAPPLSSLVLGSKSMVEVPTYNNATAIEPGNGARPFSRSRK